MEFQNTQITYIDVEESEPNNNSHFNIVVFTFSEVKIECGDDFPSWLYIIIRKMWGVYPPSRINANDLVKLFKAYFV